MNKLQASLLTFAGGASYGLLSGFAKLAYRNGVHPGALATLQNLLGAIFLWAIALFLEGRPWRESSGPGLSTRVLPRLDWTQVKSLTLVGSLSGITGALYFLALTMLPAALGIILLFQFTWLGVLLEVLLERRRPDKYSLLALLLLVPGTLLAVGTGWKPATIPWAGIGLGLLSAVTYSGFLYGTGKVAVTVQPWTRSALIITGAFVVNALFFTPGFLADGGTGSVWGQTLLWSGLMGVFGPLIPTICFAYGIPVIGGGLASLLAAVELPMVITVAGLFLGEQVTGLQWLGVIVILSGIFVSQLKEI